MNASIIVSDVDSQNMLLVNVLSFCTQDFPKDQYEVILPDYGLFTKEEKTILQDFQKQHNLKLISFPGKNRSELINKAVERSKSDLLVFIESHCLASKDWLKSYATLFANKDIHVAQGDIRTVPTDSKVGQGQDKFFSLVRERFKRFGVEQSYLDFHNSAMRKSCFLQAGGLEKNIPNMCEFELGARLHQKGIPIFRFPQNVVWHFNDNGFLSYSSIVGKQGEDRTRILKLHGKEFMKKYFPNKHLISFLLLWKTFRTPMLVITKTFLFASIFAIIISSRLGFPSLTAFFFRCFAENSVRYGMLKALKEH